MDVQGSKAKEALQRFDLGSIMVIMKKPSESNKSDDSSDSDSDTETN